MLSQNEQKNYTHISYDYDDHVVTITFNRPNALNAFTIPMVEELIDAVTRAELTEGVRVIIITGAGRAFSSGGDIKEMMSSGGDAHTAKSMGRLFATKLADLTRRIRQVPIPIIAKVNGIAAGAGMSVALACDFRVVSTNAAFIMSFVNVGLVPDAGGIAWLTKIVGVAKTTQWVMLGEKITAEMANDAGMVHVLSPPESLDTDAAALAQRLKNLPTLALGKVKETINIAAFSDLEPVFTSEVVNQALLSQTEDFKEGLSAFLENRKPSFKGR